MLRRTCYIACYITCYIVRCYITCNLACYLTCYILVACYITGGYMFKPFRDIKFDIIFEIAYVFIHYLKAPYVK